MVETKRNHHVLNTIFFSFIFIFLGLVLFGIFIGNDARTGEIEEKEMFLNSENGKVYGTYEELNVAKDKYKKEINYAFIVNGKTRVVHKNDFESYEVGDTITYKGKYFAFQGVNTTILSKR